MRAARIFAMQKFLLRTFKKKYFQRWKRRKINNHQAAASPEIFKPGRNDRQGVSGLLP
jgi:hypothetical protein